MGETLAQHAEAFLFTEGGSYQAQTFAFVCATMSYLQSFFNFSLIDFHFFAFIKFVQETHR